MRTLRGLGWSRVAGLKLLMIGREREANYQ